LTAVLLLDTHAWIWTVEGERRRVGPKARRTIAQAAGQQVVRISPMTLFEIVALHTAGRLQLSQPVEDWIDASLQRPGVRLAELSRVAAVDAGFIPRAVLPDPLDRLLVATARALDATLLTGDSAILSYAARTGNARVQDVAR
jgi:PIN domain nuclease of toxin-antitoxin system